MMAGSMAPYQMNAGIPPQQPMMQRIHPSQQNLPGMNASTPQRPFNPAQGTPNSSVPPQPGQFSTPQSHSTPQSQTPTNAQQPNSAAATPQTPTFPPAGQQAQANGTSTTVSTPQSPATESREKERFSVLLEINQELLYESLALVNSRAELKKEQSAAESGEKGNDIDFAEEEKLSTQDYAQCMRRLQANLTYMAALADRKSQQAPPCPAYLMPPPLNLSIRLRVPQSMPDESSEKPPDPNADRGDRDKLLKDLYRRLQALFPGIDPRKEPATQVPNQRAGAPGQHHPSQGVMKAQPNQNGQMMGGQGSNHGSPAPGPQKTPQMANAANPMMMHAGQPTGL
ncbi:hypothetical protein B0H67DRAFT_226551 [Lasiosphaeris hirsuta]|uniref:Uncharacterized protein n=1 Tax=Lasiosphaeris hirsuta TaxID=260670 RepID=A0AA40DX15_9PEZI|nr:hypothetical protein B0H67DRAFT_226551 [Lasiosphaeris hirsuta]